LWSKQDGALIGGYRIGKTAEILAGRGIDGLYTSTLFRYDARFFASLGPALELGRSFIRPEYQKKYSPLLVLWKGIGRYVAAFPEAPTLFGVVSISNRYSKNARHLMYRFLTKHQSDPELSRLVMPRRPFRPSMWNCDSLYQPLSELDHINDLVSDLEMDGKGVPILLKHYSRLGGRLAAFNVDAQFTSVLDGLIVVDLRRADSSLVDRYLGKDGARDFRSFHNLQPR
jgi:putative hemolysin